MRPSDAQMYSSLFFSGAPRRALLGLSGFSSPTVSSKCSVVPLCLSRISSNLISPWRLPHPPPAATTIAPVRFFSASDGVGVSAGEHLKRVIQAQIRRGEEELDIRRSKWKNQLEESVGILKNFGCLQLAGKAVKKISCKTFEFETC